MTNMGLAKACGVVALAGVAAVVVAGAAGWAGVGWVAGGSTAVLFGLLAAWFRAQEAREAERRWALREGSALARWTYTREEWQSWSAAEWEQAQRRCRWLPPCLGLFAGAASLFLGASGPTAAVVVVLGAAGGFALGRQLVAEAASNMNVATPHAVISLDAALVNRQLFTWTGPGLKLESLVLVEGEPAVLEFDIGTRTGRASTRVTRRVPVPAAHATEVPALRAALGFPELTTNPHDRREAMSLQ